MRNRASVTLRTAGATAALALALASCSASNSRPDQPAGRRTPTGQSDTRMPAEAERPRTAAACEGPLDGTEAVVEANPDTPKPRCLIVRPDQRLKVRNTTHRFGQPGSPVVVTFGSWSPHTLAPGESVTFNQSVGDVLSPGIHDLDLDLEGIHWAAEIFVEDEPTNPAAKKERRIRVSVHSHCGVVSVQVRGVLWLADPPLGDQNPPPGWDENQTPGYLVLTGPRAATFYGDGDQTAHFRRAPAGTPDPGAGCE